MRETPLTVLVDSEDRIAVSHAGDVDLVAFEADINALLAEWASVQLILPKAATEHFDRKKKGMLGGNPASVVRIEASGDTQ